MESPTLAGMGRELALVLAEMVLGNSALRVPSRAVAGLAGVMTASTCTAEVRP